MGGEISALEGTITTIAENNEVGASELGMQITGISGDERITKVSELIAGLESKLGECESAYSSLKKTTAEYDERSDKLRTLDEDVISLTEEINKIDPQINDLTAEVTKYKATAEEMSSGMQYASEKDAVSASASFNTEKEKLSAAELRAQEKWDELNKQQIQNTASLGDLNESIDKQSALKEDLDVKFGNALVEQGFADAGEFAGFVLGREQLRSEKEIIRVFREQYGQVLSKKMDLDSQTEGKELPDINVILERSVALDNDERDANEKITLASSRMSTNKKVRGQLAVASLKYDETESTTMKVKAMSDTANGSLKGSERITFEQFVQGVYFDEVIQRASKRLGMMSNNRFVLKRKKESDDLRKNSSLDMEVLDNHSGKTRSVRSLSGGESFKAALALALGLSDTIQSRTGGVSIETLFIDEGFGSLDADSLDQAVTVLDQLSINNALVGIISHVDMLKERIDKKIVVKHDESGSRAEIIVD